jgi:hypothetical protein
MNTSKLTRRTKVVLYVTYLLILAALFLAGAEFYLRHIGAKPWRGVPDIDVQVEPGGRLFTKHPTLGYTVIPGRFAVTNCSGYSFQVTHLPNSLRITHPLESYNLPDSHKPEIWIFGCSFTYGQGLNDNQTYPWLLQQRLKEYEVLNFAGAGYGTIHSLIQFREALKSKAPQVAVLAYAGFHDERNTFLRMRRKEIAPYNRLGPLIQPYARLNKDGSLRYFQADVVYTEFPMMRHLALAHFLENQWNEIEKKSCQSHKVSEALVMQMAKLAQEHHVKFVVASIVDDKHMLEFAAQNGISGVDISVDYAGRGLENPVDHHPNAIANKEYADKLEAFLRNGFLK